MDKMAIEQRMRSEVVVRILIGVRLLGGFFGMFQREDVFIYSVRNGKCPYYTTA